MIQGKIDSKAQVKMKYQDLNKKIKEAEVDIENYGKLQVANDGSIETKRTFYFVKVIANWEELNESEGLTSKQLSTWVTSNNPKAYLTSLARKVGFKAFSEKYAKNIGEVVKGVREAYGLIEEGTGGTGKWGVGT